MREDRDAMDDVIDDYSTRTVGQQTDWLVVVAESFKSPEDEEAWGRELAIADNLWERLSSGAELGHRKRGNYIDPGDLAVFASIVSDFMRYSGDSWFEEDDRRNIETVASTHPALMEAISRLTDA